MMRGLFFSVLLLSCVALFSGCEEDQKSKKPVKTECEPLPGQIGPLHFCKLEYDWGTIQHGDSVFVFYPFVNVKDYPVTIVEVMTSCECTIGEFPTAAIPPGGRGQIVGKFFSETQRPGSRHEKILAVRIQEDQMPYSLRMNGNIAGN